MGVITRLLLLGIYELIRVGEGGGLFEEDVWWCGNCIEGGTSIELRRKVKLLIRGHHF